MSCHMEWRRSRNGIVTSAFMGLLGTEVLSESKKCKDSPQEFEQDVKSDDISTVNIW